VSTVNAWWNDPEKRREWVKALRTEQRRRPAGSKTTINFDAAFVGKSGSPGYFVPWQPVRLFAPDGPVATPVNSGIGHGRLTVDGDELLAWFEKQEAP
jgi:hypothetical protein